MERAMHQYAAGEFDSNFDWLHCSCRCAGLCGSAEHGWGPIQILGKGGQGGEL